MNHRLSHGVLAAGLAFALPVAVYGQNDAWKQKMEDAQSAQDDLTDAIQAKSGPKALAAAAKMTAILKETKQFWAGRKMADVVRLADENLAALGEMTKMAGSGKMEKAQAAAELISTTCSACHNIHPEGRMKAK